MSSPAACMRRQKDGLQRQGWGRRGRMHTSATSQTPRSLARRCPGVGKFFTTAALPNFEFLRATADACRPPWRSSDYGHVEPVDIPVPGVGVSASTHSDHRDGLEPRCRVKSDSGRGRALRHCDELAEPGPAQGGRMRGYRRRTARRIDRDRSPPCPAAASGQTPVRPVSRMSEQTRVLPPRMPPALA